MRKEWLNPLSYPLFVVLAVALPPLHLSAFNPHFLPYKQLSSALVPFLFVASMLFVLLRLIFRGWTKAAVACFIITIALWFLLFSKPLAAVVLTVLGLVCGSVTQERHKKLVYRYLNIFSICLTVFAVRDIFKSLEVKGDPDSVAAEDERLFPRLNSLSVEKNQLPSIVHIVTDGYGANTVLQAYFDFDNSEFEARLRDMGFVVFDSAVSPYKQTLLIMAAVFSGGYIPAQSLEDRSMRQLLGLSVTQGPLKRFLVSRGAKFYITNSGYEFFPLFPGDAVVGHVGPIPKRGDQLLSIVRAISPTGFIKNPITRLVRDLSAGGDGSMFLPVSRYSDTLLAQILNDSAFYKQERPFFLYNHLLAPHPPFTIDRDGNPTKRWPEFASINDGHHATRQQPDRIAAYRDGYIEKLRYLNSRLLPQLKDMIAAIPSPKIIILHGDHGPGSALHHDDLQKTCIHERYHPFLAVYTDNEKLRAALQELSSPAQGPFNLVNLYRVIFKYYFDAPIELLPNKSFFAPWGALKTRTLVSPESIQAVCK